MKIFVMVILAFVSLSAFAETPRSCARDYWIRKLDMDHDLVGYKKCLLRAGLSEEVAEDERADAEQAFQDYKEQALKEHEVRRRHALGQMLRGLQVQPVYIPPTRVRETTTTNCRSDGAGGMRCTSD